MASPVDTSVKFTHARLPGALEFGSGAGAMISLLDAFLVNGYALKSVDSGVIADGICTLTFSSGVGPYMKDTVILVAGATPAALNGEQKLTAATENSVSFVTDLPDGTVTGTVTFKCAPCGWEKVYSKTNVAVYRPADIRSSRFYLRVDHADASYARVMMYEAMTSVDSGTNGIPTAAVASGGYYWRCGALAGKDFMLFGDGAALLPVLHPSQRVVDLEANGMAAYFAGDIVSYRSGDVAPGVLTGSPSSSYSHYGSLFSSNSINYQSMLRAASGFGRGLTAERLSGWTNSVSGGSSQPLGSVLLSADAKARYAPILISNGGSFANTGVRGEFAGALACINTGAIDAFGVVRRVVEVERGDFKRYMTVPVSESSGAASGLGFIDITGPWR